MTTIFKDSIWLSTGKDIFSKGWEFIGNTNHVIKTLEDGKVSWNVRKKKIFFFCKKNLQNQNYMILYLIVLSMKFNKRTPCYTYRKKLKCNLNMVKVNFEYTKSVKMWFFVYTQIEYYKHKNSFLLLFSLKGPIWDHSAVN